MTEPESQDRVDFSEHDTGELAERSRQTIAEAKKAAEDVVETEDRADPAPESTPPDGSPV